jgi:hypothetical protein
VIADLINHITGLDGPVFVGWLLIIVASCIYAAAQIAKLGQTQAVEPTDPRDFDGNVNARWRG